jgi:hypothetical protein
MSDDEQQQAQSQSAAEAGKAASELNTMGNDQETHSPSGLTVFDEHEVDFYKLNNALTRMVTIVDSSLKSRTATRPVLKLNKDHVEFFMKQTALTKLQAEALLLQAEGSLANATKLYLETPFDQLL